MTLPGAGKVFEYRCIRLDTIQQRYGQKCPVKFARYMYMLPHGDARLNMARWT